MNQVTPWSFTAGNGDLIEVTQEHIDAAKTLIEEGWYQTSRRHRMLSRLPYKTTGVFALIQACLRYGGIPRQDVEKWATGMGETHAGDHYLRVYAGYDGNDKTVDIPTFAAYRKLGGDTYTSARYRHERLQDREIRS